MKHFELEGQLRTDLGKAASRNMRKKDIVPCVLYGNGNNLNFSVTRPDIRNLIYSPNVYLVDLKIDDKLYPCVIKELQSDPVKSTVNHIDFFAISTDKPVSIHVPMVIKGLSIGVKGGGKLKKVHRLIHIMALPVNIPDFIELDITNLDVGQSIKVKDVVVENIEMLDSKNKMLVIVESARGVETVEEEAAAAAAATVAAVAATGDAEAETGAN